MIVPALILIYLRTISGAMNCQRDRIHFEKVIGLRPSDGFHALLLHQGMNGAAVMTDCVAKCSINDECLSFVLHYKNSSCFWFRNEVRRFHEEESVFDNDVAWFTKTCLRTNKKCTGLWKFERVPGATLIGNNTKKLPNLITRNQCQQYCLDETSFECRSAKFRVQPLNSVASTFYDESNNLNSETRGICTLSNSDRHLSPNAYRVSGYDEEYFENQCTKAITNEYCAFEEYENLILAHVDLTYHDRTKYQCQKDCEENTLFKCRGYSLLPTSKVIMGIEPNYTCNINSENSKLHGPKSLQERVGAKYYERAPCLNISVTCSKDLMTVVFKPDMAFNGRMYMKGYSENPECNALGNKTEVVKLRIPLMVHKCGVLEVRSPMNRTLMSSTMVLQYNPLVQTQADRIIKVGCIFGNTSTVVIGAGFNFTEDHATSGSTLVNSTANLPIVEMRILDLTSKGEVSDTQIGDELQLVIEMKPGNSGIDMFAGHLIAMTENGQDSILLVDDRGCPTNLDVFPGFRKTVTNSTITLTSTFQAFKFSTSNIIRFSVIVQFCAKTCKQMQCNGNTFYKRKRELTDGSSIRTVNRSVYEEEGMQVVNKMPLEFVLVVRNANTKPDRLVYGENNRILVAGFDYVQNEVCIDFSLLMGLIITWILIQIILLVSCIILIRKYKRHYENQCTNESLEQLHKNFGIGFSNLEGNRRVHFADGHLT